MNRTMMPYVRERCVRRYMYVRKQAFRQSDPSASPRVRRIFSVCSA
jgi:hypothetical protein